MTSRAHRSVWLSCEVVCYQHAACRKCYWAGDTAGMDASKLPFCLIGPTSIASSPLSPCVCVCVGVHG